MVRVMLMLLCCWTASAAQGKAIVDIGSDWRYYDKPELVNPSWYKAQFDDSHWPVGRAQFGYGEGDEVTVTSYGDKADAKPIAQFYRQHFTVDTQATEALTLNLLVDDGAIIYINGQEAYRANLPQAYHAEVNATATFIEHVWLSVPLDPALLKLGNNVIAVAVHQLSPRSTDISFDLGLHY